MAEKRVCDRCGKEIPDGNAFDSLADSFRQHLVVKKFYLASMQDIDLCADCESELFSWLERKECKCGKNENVLELLDQLDGAERQICDLKEQVEILQQKNKALSEEQIKKLLEKCHISFEMRFEDQL